MNFVLAVQALTDGSVEFAIIDGWPAIMHGSAHLTKIRSVLFAKPG